LYFFHPQTNPIYTLPSANEEALFGIQHLEDEEPFFLSDDTNKLINTCTQGDDCEHPSCNVSYFVCSKSTLPKLRKVQSFVNRMLYHANHPVRDPIILLLVVIWCSQGGYLIWKRHFDWRNLPGTGYVWLPNPCDGVARYFRKWLKFVVIDMYHPKVSYIHL